MVLVGNKCDLEENREVSKETGTTYAAENDLPFLEASAKSIINVTQSFEEIVRQIEAAGGNEPDSSTPSTESNRARKRTLCTLL